MRLKVDKASDALYFRLDESTIVDSEEVRPGIILDFNERGQVVGVEFLGIHARTTEHELTSLHFEATQPRPWRRVKQQRAVYASKT